MYGIIISYSILSSWRKACFLETISGSPDPSGDLSTPIPTVNSNWGSRSSRVYSRWFKLFPEKLLVSQVILGPFWNIGQKWQKSISLEPLVIRTWLTPHFNPRIHFSNSVWYDVCSSDPQKRLKVRFPIFLKIHWILKIL